jgi:hypothetical protein
MPMFVGIKIVFLEFLRSKFYHQQQGFPPYEFNELLVLLIARKTRAMAFGLSFSKIGNGIVVREKVLAVLCCEHILSLESWRNAFDLGRKYIISTNQERMITGLPFSTK